MRFTRQTIEKFSKFVAIGALVGIVFSVIFIVLPAAALLFLLNTLDVGWNLQWVPSAPVLMTLGAVGGGLFSAALFIKDRYIPYVEEVPDFEADAEEPGTDPYDKK
ncbi:hypothetical protein [uncultured Sneathiella sp.]|uniref:hypothetical protein n=1 Tax=uncultured Sneathiella sp. TaxID=879315 RepID=UPI0030D7EDAF